jgi:hypothetical protein
LTPVGYRRLVSATDWLTAQVGVCRSKRLVTLNQPSVAIWAVATRLKPSQLGALKVRLSYV